MENETETLDSTNEEEVTDAKEGENQETDATKELEDKNKQLFERAKKSETEVKELRDKIKNLTMEEKEEKKLEQSNEPDYGQLAYLNAKGIEHPDDIQVVKEEANRLKLSLTDIMAMEHIQSKLKTNKELRESQEGMPEGKRGSGGKTKHDVDYWVNREGLPDDQKLAEQVVNARMGKEADHKFSDTLYTG